MSGFVMQGARSAIATGGLGHIEAQVAAIEGAVAENPGLTFDLAKTLIESACRTILTERGVPFDRDDDVPDLFKKVTRNIQLLPPELATDSDARTSLVKTLNGLHTAVQGVCELRNKFTFASHGMDGPRPEMETVQALLAARSADAIIGFLYVVHDQRAVAVSSKAIQYQDNPEFNEWIDDQCEPVQILSLPSFMPSEVLFNMDQTAYCDVLANYRDDEGEAEPVVAHPTPAEAEGASESA